MQNNVSKLWNIKAKILAQHSHQGIESNSYLLRAQSTGRQIVRSERNIRPVARARTSPPRADPELSQDEHASAVLCTDDVSVSFQPSSILKRTVCQGEGLWLSPTQPGLAPTTEGGAALTALQVAISPSSRPHTHRGTTQRTRCIQVSPVISLLDTDNVETFELEDIRLLERSKRTTGFRYEVFAQTEAAKALQDKI